MRVNRVFVYDSLKNYILVDDEDNILVGNSITVHQFGKLCVAMSMLE